MPLTISDADTKDNKRFWRLHISSALLRAGRCDFLAADDDVTDVQRMATEHQDSAHTEATDGAVVLQINLGRSHSVILQASLERRHIEAAVLCAKCSLQCNG